MGSLGMTMSYTCVDWTCLPSGKLIVSSLTATRLLLTLAPSIMKMEVDLVSAMACVVAIVNAFRYCGEGQPNNLLAAKARVCHARVAVLDNTGATVLMQLLHLMSQQ